MHQHQGTFGSALWQKKNKLPPIPRVVTLSGQMGEGGGKEVMDRDLWSRCVSACGGLNHEGVSLHSYPPSPSSSSSSNFLSPPPLPFLSLSFAHLCLCFFSSPGEEGEGEEGRRKWSRINGEKAVGTNRRKTRRRTRSMPKLDRGEGTGHMGRTGNNYLVDGT